MADTVYSSSVLNLIGDFRDGDDRTINLDNPKVDVDDASAMAAYATEINNVGTYIKDNQLLIGDKAGADFIRFKSAKVVYKQVTRLDLS